MQLRYTPPTTLNVGLHKNLLTLNDELYKEKCTLVQYPLIGPKSIAQSLHNMPEIPLPHIIRKTLHSISIAVYFGYCWRWERPLKYKFSLTSDWMPFRRTHRQFLEAHRTQISNITWKQCKKCCFILNSIKPHHNYGFVRWARNCIMEKDENPNHTTSHIIWTVRALLV